MKAVLLLSLVAAAFAAPEPRWNLEAHSPRKLHLFLLWMQKWIESTCIVVRTNSNVRAPLLAVKDINHNHHECERFTCSECVEEMRNLGFLVRAGAKDIRVREIKSFPFFVFEQISDCTFVTTTRTTSPPTTAQAKMTNSSVSTTWRDTTLACWYLYSHQQGFCIWEAC